MGIPIKINSVFHLPVRSLCGVQNLKQVESFRSLFCRSMSPPSSSLGQFGIREKIFEELKVTPLLAHSDKNMKYSAVNVASLFFHGFSKSGKQMESGSEPRLESGSDSESLIICYESVG